MLGDPGGKDSILHPSHSFWCFKYLCCSQTWLLTCYTGQLMAIFSQKWWNRRGGEKGWENVKTWTRTVTGGVANQRVLVYPVNEAHPDDQMQLCSQAIMVCDLIDSYMRSSMTHPAHHIVTQRNLEHFQRQIFTGVCFLFAWNFCKKSILWFAIIA